MLDLPRPGQLVAGKYLTQEELGRGGMGRVLAARHLSLDCPVALKFLSAADLDELALERFLREARAAAQIESDHVARVMDAARLDTGMPYIVMERLTGVNLKALLAREGPLPVAVAVDYLLQACDAIAEAHARGIVHRDLKPSNLFLSDRADGTRVVKVLDFGVSKMRREPALEAAETTSAEVILGSPQYMAPEQIRSAKYADARSDIWSLGGILYELLAGRPAYRAETLPGLLASIVADEPRPLSAIRADVPAALQSSVHRCFEKDPRRRFQSVGELARALAPFAPAARKVLIERICRFSSDSAPRSALSASAAVPLTARKGGLRLGGLAVLALLLTLGLIALRWPAAPRLVTSAAVAPLREVAGAQRASTGASTVERELTGPLAEEPAPRALPDRSDPVPPGHTGSAQRADPLAPSSVRAARLDRAAAAPVATAAPARAPFAAEAPAASAGIAAPPLIESRPESEPPAAARTNIPAPAPPRARDPLDVFSDPR